MFSYWRDLQQLDKDWPGIVWLDNPAIQRIAEKSILHQTESITHQYAAIYFCRWVILYQIVIENWAVVLSYCYLFTRVEDRVLLINNFDTTIT